MSNRFGGECGGVVVVVGHYIDWRTGDQGGTNARDAERYFWTMAASKKHCLATVKLLCSNPSISGT